jgi:hypothetical protein
MGEENEFAAGRPYNLLRESSVRIYAKQEIIRVLPLRYEIVSV